MRVYVYVGGMYECALRLSVAVCVSVCLQVQLSLCHVSNRVFGHAHQVYTHCTSTCRYNLATESDHVHKCHCPSCFPPFCAVLCAEAHVES